MEHKLGRITYSPDQKKNLFVFNLHSLAEDKKMAWPMTPNHFFQNIAHLLKFFR